MTAQIDTNTAYRIAAVPCVLVGLTQFRAKTLGGTLASVALVANTIYRAFGDSNKANINTVNLLSKVIVQASLLFYSPLLLLSDLIQNNKTYAAISAAVVLGGVSAYGCGLLGFAKTARIAGTLFLHLGIAPILGGASMYAFTYGILLGGAR
jgi:hypothetical protein